MKAMRIFTLSGIREHKPCRCVSATLGAPLSADEASSAQAELRSDFGFDLGQIGDRHA
jgi:hypothetical protein